LTALLVVALAARDRDLLDSVGIDEHEPTETDVRFEDIAVLTPKITGEGEEPPALNARAKAIGPTPAACTITPLPAMRVRVSEPCAAVSFWRHRRLRHAAGA
jgi:hypothetical protein